MPFINKRPAQNKVYWRGALIPNISIRNAIDENKSIIPKIFTAIDMF